MIRIGLVGIGAGAAAALLFASVISGSLLSMVLFYLAPLPMMIAALGWSHWAALIGALAGALALSVAFGSLFFFAFLAIAGLPGWWLGYLAMLARAAPAGGNGGQPPLEWYPPGRLAMWAALLAALTVLTGILYVGDAASLRAALHDMLTQVLRAETAEPNGPLIVPGIANAERLIEFLVQAIPPAVAVLATITNLLNLWLAGRIVKFSGRLARPWPDLAAMTFPRPLPAVLAIAVGLSLVGGLVGILASVLAAALVMAFGVLGLAVLHAVTQGINARGWLLGGVYAAVLVIGWPVLALCLLGLIETLAGVRARVARLRPPSLPPPAHS